MHYSLRFDLNLTMAKQYSLHMWVWAAQTLYVQCRSVTRALRNNLKTQNTTAAGMPKIHTQYRFWDSC